MHSCREKTPVATPTPAPARTPCPQGCGKTTFCTHARTHARGFRADEALASRGGGFTAIHSSLNSTQHTGCDDSRRHSREKKSRRVRVRRRRAPFQPIVNNKLVFFRQPRSLAARVRARARARICSRRFRHATRAPTKTKDADGADGLRNKSYVLSFYFCLSTG